MKAASITIIISENEGGGTNMQRFLVGISAEGAASVCRSVAYELDRESIRAAVLAEVAAEEQEGEGSDRDHREQ